MLAKSKSEANFLLSRLDDLSSRQGLVIKAGAVVAPIGRESSKEHNGTRKRWRQRSRRKRD
jgi:hypothetical protein